MPPGGDAIEEISSGCLAVRVRMLGRAVTAVYERALASRELSVAQMNILVFVGKQGPCPPAVVGQMLQMERSTVSRNLRPMLERGWLAAETHDAGHLREVRLTARGRKELEAALPAWREAQAEAEKLLGAGGTQAVRTLGDRLWRGAAT